MDDDITLTERDLELLRISDDDSIRAGDLTPEMIRVRIKRELINSVLPRVERGRGERDRHIGRAANITRHYEQE